ncbi:MAG: Crp/Fnr family transcriptional regulator [Saprospiraceae bacterium]|nr:Crp/Fnr family transcriptional regulator [Saprospiraceae bacterium]
MRALKQTKCRDALTSFNIKMEYKANNHLLRNEHIYLESEKTHWIYYLVEGTIRIYRAHPSKSNYFTLQIIQEGNYFGYIEVFTKERIRMSSAVVLSEFAIVKKHRIEDFFAELIEDEDFFLSMLRLSANYKKQLWDRYYTFREYDSFRKIAWMLIEMATPTKHDKDIFEIKNYTHLLLGQYTGSSRQTITSALNEYRNLGIIEYNRNQILIKKTLIQELIKK